MECQAKDCENTATTSRTAKLDSGSHVLEVTYKVCEVCAAAIDDGNPPEAFEVVASDA